MSVDGGITGAFLAKVLGAAVVVGLTVFRMAPVPASAPVAAAASSASTTSVQDRETIERSVYYPGCRAARAAGVAPIYRGSPGYRSGMDGDHDGIACEPIRED